MERTGPGTFAWIIVGLNALALVGLVIAVILDAAGPTCSSTATTAAPALCTEPDGLGLIGVWFYVTLWAAADVILGVVWLVTRRPRTPSGIYVRSWGSQYPAQR